MRIGFKTSQANVDWPTLLATWEHADAELPIFESAWLFDHFVSLGAAGGGSHEGWTLLSALAARTRRLQLGHLVLSNTYRHPAVLARMGASLDHVADGRFVLGLGAGWHDAEHAMYGLRLPPIGERMTMLESAVRLIKALWQAPNGVSLDAAPYRLRDAVCDPPPLTEGGPPIWLGGQRPRGLRMAARLADGWNHNGSSLQDFDRQRDILFRELDTAGRDPAAFEVSVQLRTWDTPASEVLDLATRYGRAGADHIILMVDPTNGPTGLARLAREVAEPLRERIGA